MCGDGAWASVLWLHELHDLHGFISASTLSAIETFPKYLFNRYRHGISLVQQS